ncbi:MAG: hypothetical protein ACI9C4_002770 [Paraglaciecola sp.]|jgi:hypothetical protein
MYQDTKRPIIFVLSVDTEEEWDWSGPFPEQKISVKNIDKLPAFHKMCTGLGVRPTYFVDYAVADSDTAVKAISSFSVNGNCEIGAHLHPWCNPPYIGETNDEKSHVINLPIELVSQKLDSLVERIEQQFLVKPTSFRTGRWGIDGKVLNLLLEAGFTVDSSIYPYYKNEYFSCYGAPPLPYWPDLTNPLQQAQQNKIYELPVTVGFNQQNFSLCNQVHSLFSEPPYSWTRFNGVAWHTRLLRKNFLCPELSLVDDMLALCDTVINKDYPVLHMYMHSSSLVDNNNSPIGNHNAERFISTAVEQVITRLKNKYNVEFCTITEAAQKLQYLNEQ